MVFPKFLECHQSNVEIQRNVNKENSGTKGPKNIFRPLSKLVFGYVNELSNLIYNDLEFEDKMIGLYIFTIRNL